MKRLLTFLMLLLLAVPAAAMRIPNGTTDKYVYFVAVDSGDYQTRETGLSSFTVYYSINGAAAVAMTTPTVNETDSTNMPGVYELLIDEADMTTIDTGGDDSEELCLHITHGSMDPVTRVIEIYRPKITEGETATVSSGIVESNVQQVGDDAITDNGDGRLEVNVEEWKDTAVNEDSAGWPSVTVKDGTGTGELYTDSGTVLLSSATETQIDNIETGTAAYDTDAEYAGAIWNAATNAYGAAGTYGLLTENMAGVVDTIDGNVADIDTDIGNIAADTAELQTDWVNGGRLDLLIDLMLADTAELQTDWVNGGRLDLLIDLVLEDTGTTIPGLIGAIAVGDGSVVVDHDTGGTDALAYKTSGGAGIDNAVVRAYLKTDYDAGNTGSAYIKATTTTDVNGRWTAQMNLDPATYTLYFFKQNTYGPDTQEVTVE